MGNIFLYKADELIYNMDSQQPYVLLKTAMKDSYSRQETVDPFPCYMHDEKLVFETLKECAAIWNPATDVACSILGYEPLNRWNGYCDVDYDWSQRDADIRPFTIRITLAGKRMPIHPAMTRYTVAHEYGHAVEKWLALGMRMKDATEFREFYSKTVRWQEKFYTGYQARHWHENVAELIANDVRIRVLGVDTDYWPHKGYFHPKDETEYALGIFKFWLDAREQFGKLPEEPFVSH